MLCGNPGAALTETDVAPIAQLVGTAVPSMLMEVGCLTNSREDWLFTSSHYQNKLVTGMISGVCAYMGRPAPAAISQE